MTDPLLVPLITCQNINVYYRKHHVLNDISGIIKQGSLTAVVGPNGGGKSTFLKAIIGLAPLDSGHISFANNDITKVAYLPQNNLIDRSFPITVFDLVASGHISHLGLFKEFNSQHQQQTFEAIELLGLKDCAHKSIAMLSGGQFQRCLFARLSLQNCATVLLDEPFTAIDAYTTEILQDLIIHWHQNGKTILTVCHDLDIVHQYYPDSILIAGKCIGWGSTHDTLTTENWHQAKKMSQILEQK